MRSLDYMRTYLVLLLFYASLTFQSQTATNFTVKNCNGQTFSLFEALDSGQIVVLTFVTPGNNGINHVESAYDIVQEFQINYPNRVFMYVCDAHANTSCANLGTWLAERTFSQCASFSDTSISMMDYNLNGVPKFVVIGTSAHVVFDVQADNLNHSVFRDAIKSILIGPISKGDSLKNFFQTTLRPNPSNNKITIGYRLSQPERLMLEVYNSQGKCVKKFTNGYEQTGNHEAQVDTQVLPEGSYFFRISNGKNTDTIKFLIVH